MAVEAEPGPESEEDAVGTEDLPMGEVTAPPVDASAEDGATSDTAVDAGMDTGAGDPETAGDSGTVNGDKGPGSDLGGAEDTPAVTDAGTKPVESAGGCSCQTGEKRDDAALFYLLGLLALLGWRRRVASRLTSAGSRAIR
jgi:MYXO-CTERM domain-containing protein